MQKVIFSLAAGVSFILSGIALSNASDTYEFERISLSSTTAQRFTVSKTTGTDRGDPGCAALVTVETGAMRFRIDGTTPTATIGHLVQANQSFLLEGNRDLREFKAIANNGVDVSTITASFFKGCR
jgi:hypothetical protein